MVQLGILLDISLVSFGVRAVNAGILAHLPWACFLLLEGFFV